MSKMVRDEELVKVYEKTPRDIKVILTSDIIKEELLDVLSKYKINEEQERLFFKEILAVSLLVTSKKNFIENITDILDLSMIESTEISKKVEEIVFDRIRKVNEGLNSDYLNIDNNIDYFSNNDIRKVELPKEIKDKINMELDYDSYVFLKSKDKIL